MVPQKSAVKQFVRVYAFIYDESLVQGKVLDDTVPVFVSGMVRYGLRYIIGHRRYFKNICIVYSIERRKQTVGITARRQHPFARTLVQVNSGKRDRIFFIRRFFQRIAAVSRHLFVRRNKESEPSREQFGKYVRQVCEKMNLSGCHVFRESYPLLFGRAECVAELFQLVCEIDLVGVYFQGVSVRCFRQRVVVIVRQQVDRCLGQCGRVAEFFLRQMMRQHDGTIKIRTYLIGVLPPFAFDDSGRVVVAWLIDDNQFVERFDARVDTKSQKLRIVLNSQQPCHADGSLPNEKRPVNEKFGIVVVEILTIFAGAFHIVDVVLFSARESQKINETFCDVY